MLRPLAIKLQIVYRSSSTTRCDEVGGEADNELEKPRFCTVNHVQYYVIEIERVAYVVRVIVHEHRYVGPTTLATQSTQKANN
jgi:hypothetical protein